MKNTVTPIKRKDHRMYDFHRTFGTINTIVPNFNFDTLGLKPNQTTDGLPEACTSYTNNDTASNEDNTIYDDYDWLYRKTLLMMNANYGEPCDVITSLKASTVWGVKSKVMTETQAVKRAPYFIVKESFDYFDGLISGMQIKKGTLSCATPWFRQFEFTNETGITQSPPNWNDLSNASWHAWECCGLKTINSVQYLICKSWQGSVFGDKGYNYFTREQINALLSTRGAGCFAQKKATLADIQSVKMNMIQTCISFIYMIINNLLNPTIKTMPENTPNQSEIAPNVPIESPKTPVKVPETLDWSNPISAKHAVRVTCDRQGLSLINKNIISACIEEESNFDNNAICHNKNTEGIVTSSDWGIVQCNDHYHIGEGKDFPSVDYVLANPEKMVLWMINMFKVGKLNMWVSYSSGAYKKHL